MDGIRGYFINSAKICTRVNSLSALTSAKDPDTKLLWIDIEGDLSAEIETALSETLEWHPIVIENFHLASSRPKMINFDSYSQVTLHALKLSGPNDESQTVEIDMVISKNYLISHHQSPVLSIDETMEDLQKGILNVGPDELMYHLISHIIEKYAPAIEEKKDMVGALEEEALYSPNHDLLERIVLQRNQIIELGLAMAPQQIILMQMANGVCRHIRPYIQPYFRDAESRMGNLIDEEKSYKEVLANTLELYRSAMSSRTNDAMKVLTAMSALFLPLTFLTGLFGMNVHLPLSTHHYAFLAIIGLCIFSFGGMMTYFKWKKWF